MVQVSDIRADDGEVTDQVVIERIHFVESRSHRVTVEWVLEAQPAAVWTEAFDATVREDGVLRSFVPSAYGRPMVMHDCTIVWAVAPADLQSSLDFVEQTVAHANARLEGLAAQPAAGGDDAA